MPQPRIRMFAGPNGSGKSTVKEYLLPHHIGAYLNADELEQMLNTTHQLNLMVYHSALKAQDLIRENPNNFYESRIVSDIRIVYDDDSELQKKEQFALIVHHLRIKYFSKAKPRDEIFISLDIADLHNLRKVIDRAIEKDELMRTNNHELTFVNPK